MAEVEKPHLVGFNHIALEVGDIEEDIAVFSSSNCAAKVTPWLSST
jgi:hypothetical protein